jgi:GTPase SAR1 family protein
MAVRKERSQAHNKNTKASDREELRRRNRDMSLYKITVLGTGGVGKTAVTIRLCSNHFVEYYGASKSE